MQKDFRSSVAAISVVIALVMVSVACRSDRSSSTSPANSPSPTSQQLAVINDLRKLAETQCGTKAEKIDVDAPLVTVGCDELDVVELIMAVEDKYNLTIPDIPGERVTINSLARIIDNR